MASSKSVTLAASAAAVTLLCSVGFAQTTQPIQYNDVIFAASAPNAAQTTRHIRGNPGIADAGVQLGSTWTPTFVQSIKFDNSDGLRHNYTGNIIGLDFGNLATGGGIIHNMASNRVANDPNPGVAQKLFNIRDYNTANNTFFLESRLSGICVSPLNNRIAFTGNDSAEAFCLDYNAGAAVGTGAGASVSNLRSGGNLLAGGSKSHGAGWLDNDNFLAVSDDGTLVKFNVTAGAITPSNVGNIPVTAGANTFSSVLYEPTMSPNIYILTSDFTTSVTTNRLYVLNANTFASVGSFDYSSVSVMNTARDIAFDVNGNLLITERASPTNNPAIDVVPHGNILSNLANNNSQNYWTITVGTTGFNGADVGAALLDYKTAGLTNNVRAKSLVVRYFPGQVSDPQSVIRQRLQAGRNGGAWNGTGSAIISTDAANDGAHDKAIGYAQASELGLIGGTFAGVAVDGPAVLMKYTYYGDTDLNGQVNGADYARTDTTFNNEQTQGDIGGWFNGDFDYNNKVDGADYALIDSAFNSQNGVLARMMSFLDGSDRNRESMNTHSLQLVLQHFDTFGDQYTLAALSNIPEPATLGAASLIGLSALARRRRSR